jgi:hypothetical protein
MSLNIRIRLYFHVLLFFFFSCKFVWFPALNDFFYKLTSFGTISFCALLFAVVFFPELFLGWLNKRE